MAHLKLIGRVSAGAILLALALAGCTSDQDPSRTPIGSVVTGKTDSPDAYLNQVQEANQARQANGQSVSPVGPNSAGHY